MRALLPTRHHLIVLAVDDLLGDAAQQRVGKFTTVVALDWDVEKQLKKLLKKNDPALIKKCIETAHDELVQASRLTFKAKLQQAMETKLHEGACTENEKKKIAKRVEVAMDGPGKTRPGHVQSFAIDVQGLLAQYTDVNKPLSMEALVQQMLANNQSNLEQQQTACLHDVVSDCLLPFYTKLNQLGTMRELTDKGKSRLDDSRLQQLRAAPLLKGVRAAIDNHLSTPNNTLRMKKLEELVLDPKKTACTEGAMMESKEYKCYTERHSRRLSSDLKSASPERTLLPNLTMKPLVCDVMLPLQNVRRSHSN